VSGTTIKNLLFGPESDAMDAEEAQTRAERLFAVQLYEFLVEYGQQEGLRRRR
jgi:hypothetical protein